MNHLIVIDNQDRIKPAANGEFYHWVEHFDHNALILGQWQQNCFAAKLIDEIHPRWLNARHWLTLCSEQQFNLLTKAIQLAHWWREHQFCGRCGQPTKALLVKEFVRICSQCGLQAYPRISPCVIMLISRFDKILLARSPTFPKDRFSVLAGFIGVGESAEQAVCREVKEEVDLEISDICYFASQSWPFPHSLMLAFFATAKTSEIKVNSEEIEAAGWFSYDYLPDLPPEGTIARALIEKQRRNLFY